MDNIPIGYCQCGCGQKTSLAPQTDTKRGWVKGKPVRFVQFHRCRLIHKSREQRLWAKIDKRDMGECWEWKGYRDAHGYGIFGKNHGILVRSHRFVYEITQGKIPDGMIVCHKCDNPPCCNPSHLFLGTPADNSRDCKLKGRARGPKGIDNASAKLTTNDVLEIRRLWSVGVKPVAIASAYSVDQSSIWNIIKHKTWRHI